MADEHVTIETPEHVTLSYELAGAGSRLFAAVLDHLIVALLLCAILLVALALRMALPWLTAPAVAVAIVLGGPVLLMILYFAVLEAAWGGQTPGKQAAGLRVMRDDGTPITILDALIRNALRLIDFLPYLYFVGGIVSFLHPHGKRLGDLAAGTVIVKMRESALPRSVAPAAESPWPAPLEDLVTQVRPCAHLVTAEELAAVRRFLARRAELAPEVRRQLAERILSPLRDKLALDATEAGSDPEALLEALAHVAARSGERF